MCYLLTTRFQEDYDKVLRLVQAFIWKVGSALQPKQLNDFLLVVSQLKVRSYCYEAWEDCIGAFM